MKLKYILNEVDGKTILKDEEELKEALNKYCPNNLKAIENGKNIIIRYRQPDDRYLIVNPALRGDRVSANTHNYYTLLIDNSSEWKKYPKRSKGIICSLREKSHFFSIYDGSFYVIPFDHAKFGVCPKNDLWPSFQETLGKYNVYTVERLSEILHYLFILAMNKEEREKVWQDERNRIADLNYQKLLELLKRIKDLSLEYIINDREIYNFFTGPKEIANEFISKLIANDNLKFLNDLLSPDYNNFSLGQVPSLVNKNFGDNDRLEVWTDAPCILIRSTEISI